MRLREVFDLRLENGGQLPWGRLIAMSIDLWGVGRNEHGAIEMTGCALENSHSFVAVRSSAPNNEAHRQKAEAAPSERPLPPGGGIADAALALDRCAGGKRRK